MRYSEFKRDAEAMGYSLVNGENVLYVRKGKYSLIISVGLRSTYTINSNFEHFRNLEEMERERLLNLVWQLASTPLEEREDEKRYRLWLPLAKNIGYLNLDETRGTYEISNKFNQYGYRTIFTESEIEALKVEHNLDSFVLEGVKEDEG